MNLNFDLDRLKNLIDTPTNKRLIQIKALIEELEEEKEKTKSKTRISEIEQAIKKLEEDRKNLINPKPIEKTKTDEKSADIEKQKKIDAVVNDLLTAIEENKKLEKNLAELIAYRAVLEKLEKENTEPDTGGVPEETTKPENSSENKKIELLTIKDIPTYMCGDRDGFALFEKSTDCNERITNYYIKDKAILFPYDSDKKSSAEIIKKEKIIEKVEKTIGKKPLVKKDVWKEYRDKFEKDKKNLYDVLNIYLDSRGPRDHSTTTIGIKIPEGIDPSPFMEKLAEEVFKADKKIGALFLTKTANKDQTLTYDRQEFDRRQSELKKVAQELFLKYANKQLSNETEFTENTEPETGGVPEETPEPMSDFESKKADIERRRQEELMANRDYYWNNDHFEKIREKINNNPLSRIKFNLPNEALIRIEKSKSGRETAEIIDEYNGTDLVRGSYGVHTVPDIIEDAICDLGIQYPTADEINAKYDAELAELENATEKESGDLIEEKVTPSSKKEVGVQEQIIEQEDKKGSEEKTVEEKILEILNKELDWLNKRLEGNEMAVPDGSGVVRMDENGNFLDAGDYIKDGGRYYKEKMGSEWESDEGQALKNAREYDYPKVKKIWTELKRQQNILKSELANKIVLLATQLGGLEKLKNLLDQKYLREQIGFTPGLRNSFYEYIAYEGNKGKLESIEKIIDAELAELEKKETAIEQIEEFLGNPKIGDTVVAPTSDRKMADYYKKVFIVSKVDYRGVIELTEKKDKDPEITSLTLGAWNTGYNSGSIQIAEKATDKKLKQTLEEFIESKIVRPDKKTNPNSFYFTSLETRDGGFLPSHYSTDRKNYKENYSNFEATPISESKIEVRYVTNDINFNMIKNWPGDYIKPLFDYSFESPKEMLINIEPAIMAKTEGGWRVEKKGKLCDAKTVKKYYDELGKK